MIVRVWKGIAVPEMADQYLVHLKHTLFPELAMLDGFRGAQVLKREVSDGVEYTVQTRWESMDAIRQFAGAQVDTAVVAPDAQPLFVRYDPTVTHCELVLESEGQEVP